MKTLLLFFSFLFVTSVAMAGSSLPLAKKGEIPTPQVLADRVRESLENYPSGDGSIRGANITPNEYLEAVQTAGGTVDTVGELPTYLENLLETKMPAGSIRLSQVLMKKDGSKELDLKIGRYRRPFDGEKGWYDANTGKLILAGHCTNTPINLTILINKGNIPEVEKRVSPFGKYANACSLGPTKGSVYLKPIVRAPEAAEHPCAQAHMLPQDGLLRDGKGPTSWVDGTAFSRTCGPQLASHPLGIKRHEIKVVLQKENTDQDDILFKGWLTGDKIEPAAGSERNFAEDGQAIHIDTMDRHGYVVLKFEDEAEMKTPTASGIGEDLANFKEGCRVMVFTAVE